MYISHSLSAWVYRLFVSWTKVKYGKNQQEMNCHPSHDRGKCCKIVSTKFVLTTMQIQMCFIFYNCIWDQIMLASHWPYRRDWSYSLWNSIPWNKLPITIIHMPIDILYDGFSKFDGIQLVNGLMIIHYIANVFANVGYWLCHILHQLWDTSNRKNVVELLLHDSLNTQN